MEAVEAYRRITEIEVGSADPFPRFIWISVLFPRLRRLEIRFSSRQAPPECFYLVKSGLRHLEELTVSEFYTSKSEDIADVIRGLDGLRVLDIEGNCLEPSVVVAIPSSVEHLRLAYLVDSDYDAWADELDGQWRPICSESLRVIGKHWHAMRRRFGPDFCRRPRS
mmetsp:Transcript_7021/g.17248  ORF Transcript_7021/g.17248 Transcript_7021/m.17248 type:complete len:166 (+) Transcript_7021:244-741(+)